MTLLTLDQYIDTYIHKLQINKSIKDVNNISYKIKHSNKSNSIYIDIQLNVCERMYSRTIRVSDHYLDNESTQSKHFCGLLLNPNQPMSSYKLRTLEKIIDTKIRQLVKRAPLHAIYHLTKQSLNIN